MHKLDAAELGRLTLKLGLLTSEQLDEGREEAGPKNPDPQPLLRILERKGALTPFQTAKLLKGDKDGYYLGGYRLLYRIAAGSFGRVFRADDPGTGRIVAVKVLRKRWGDDPKAVDQFYREARLGISLRHPNIVEIITVNQDAGSKQHFIVMEFVEGGNLREFLQIRKKVSAAEALRMVEDVTEGLAFAFSRGVTHRDMKLTNILISAQGESKLVDFGLAQVAGSFAGRSGGGSEDGEADQVDRTVDYAGLERATGAPPGDTRSDIYFLGCILYEMLTGRSPLDWSKNVRARMDRKRFENVQSMGRDEVQAPPSVFNLVDTMMQLAPQQRYQTPSQLLEAVRKARRDVEGGNAAKTAGPGAAAPHRSIFIVEGSEKVQEKLRAKFKEQGFRVLISSDPARALERFRQNPFDALVINAGSIGEEGFYAFESILEEARQKGITCAGVLILAAEQAAWQSRLEERPGAAVLLPPVTFKGLCQKLDELMKV